MNISRNFILVGGLYLVVGILLGMHMGASGNHAAAPAHAHINLLGFTLMTVFGLVYKVFPAMAEGRLAMAHFWLHLVGSLILLVMLYMMTTGMISEDAMVPLAPISELLILLGVLAFLWNVFRNVR
jgi:hypothetical protein